MTPQRISKYHEIYQSEGQLGIEVNLWGYSPPPYDPNYIPPIPDINDPPPPFSSIFEPNPVYIPSEEIYGPNRNRTEGHEATIVRPPSYESIINERGQTQTTHQ